MKKNMFVQTFNYKLWADDRTLRAIENINIDHNAGSYDFTLRQINHMVIVEELFKSRLTATPIFHKSTHTDIVPTFDELNQRLRESCNWYIDYVSNLDNHKELLKFEFADGKSGKMSVEEILFHIVNHGSYHRGTIAHALDLASVPHPADGYGIYIHQKEPERRNKLG